MYAVVEIGGATAIIKAGELEWSSDEDWLEKSLNDLKDPDGPSGADPQPHITMAREAVEIYGGRVVEEVIDDTPLREGVEY